MRRLWFVILTCVLAQPVTSDPARSGRAIFEGGPDAPGQVAIGNDRVAADQFPCRSCHRRDGRGGGEGDAPPITWEALSQPTGSRPAYEANAFAHLLSDGETPSGRKISRLMPRYIFEPDDVAALIGYLSILAAEQKAGVFSEKIVFGVPIPEEYASKGRGLVNLLNAVLAAKLPPNGLHGRKVEIRPLVGDARAILDQARKDVFAILSPLPSETISVSLFNEAGVPVLFPIEAISEQVDPDLTRSLYASHERVIDTLVQKAISDGCKRPHIVATNQVRASEMLARFPKQHVAPETPLADTADCILFTNRYTEPPTRQRVRVIYATGDTAVRMQEILHDHVGTLVVVRHETVAFDLATSRETDAITAHAILVVEALHNSLLAAGRDLTRSSLLSSVGVVSRPELGLAFSRNDPFGSHVVTFQTFTAASQATE